MKIQIPRLIIPEGGVKVGQARPLQVCAGCGYVLSNAGKCENILCAIQGNGDATDGLKYYNNCSVCVKKCSGH